MNGRMSPADSRAPSYRESNLERFVKHKADVRKLSLSPNGDES